MGIRGSGFRDVPTVPSTNKGLCEGFGRIVGLKG